MTGVADLLEFLPFRLDEGLSIDYVALNEGLSIDRNRYSVQLSE